jgi:hypothetical protein
MLKYGQKFLKSLNQGYAGKLNPMNPNPLNLFNAEQRGKLASFVSDKVKPDFGKSFRNYFEGRSITDGSKPLANNAGVMQGGALEWSAKGDEGLAFARKAVWGAGAGLAGAGAVGLDPFGITSAAGDVASFAAHGAVGTSFYRMGGRSKLAGLGYLGLTAANTLRGGDNLGPM